MASLKKRGKIWYIKFSETSGGQSVEITRSLKTRNKLIAQQRKQLLEDRAHEGADPFSPHFNWDVTPKKEWWTVDECRADFLEAKQRYRPATIRGHKFLLSKWIAYFNLADRLITDIQPEHFEKFLLRDGISPSTMHSEKRRLKAFWNWLLKKGRVSEDLIGDIDLPQKNVEYYSKMLTEDELQLVFRAFEREREKRRKSKRFRRWMDQPWFIPAMALFFYGGLRRSEVGRENGDEKSGLTGSNLIGSQGGGIDYIYLSKAKINRERFIPVHPKLEQCLLDYFTIRGWPDKDEYVFLNPQKGTPITGRTMYDAFKRYCQKAGVPDSRTMHGLRHSRATEWLADGFSLKEVKDMLGHRSVATTDEIYGHLVPRKLLEKSRRIYPT